MVATKSKTNKSDMAVGIVKPPPEVTVPVVPAGYVAPSAQDYRGFRPKKAELAVVPDVVIELGVFTDYKGVFGKTAPPADHITRALGAAGAWSKRHHEKGSTVMVDVVVEDWHGAGMPDAIRDVRLGSEAHDRVGVIVQMLVQAL